MKQISNIVELNLFDEIWMHPDNYSYFMKQIGVVEQEYYSFSIYQSFNIKVDTNLPKYARKWKFPDTPFVEYGEADEVWARPVRFGYEVEDKSTPVLFVINPKLCRNYFQLSVFNLNKSILYTC